MIKQDASIHAICLASIRGSTMKTYEFLWTMFYESNSEFYKNGISLDLEDYELVICSTIIDDDNFSILTSKRIFTKKEGQLTVGNLQGATDQNYGDFKNNNDKSFTFGTILLNSGDIFNYFIETGKPSMVMINAIRTAIKATKMTNNEIANVTRIWNKQISD